MKKVLSCRQESLHKSVEQPKCKTSATLDSLSPAHRAQQFVWRPSTWKTYSVHTAATPCNKTTIPDLNHRISNRWKGNLCCSNGQSWVSAVWTAEEKFQGFQTFQTRRTHRSKSPKKNQRNLKLFLWNYQALTPCAKVAHLIEMCCSNMCKQKKLVVICMRFKTMICHLSGDSIENLRASASASLLCFPTQQSRNVVDFLRIKIVASLLCLFVSPCAITHGYMQNLTQRSWGDKF